MRKYCDLGHISHPTIRENLGENLPDYPINQTILSLDTEVPTSTRSNLLTAGLYQLHLKIAAANSKPTLLVLEINLTGNWDDDESKMFANGIGITVI